MRVPQLEYGCTWPAICGKLLSFPQIRLMAFLKSNYRGKAMMLNLEAFLWCFDWGLREIQDCQVGKKNGWFTVLYCREYTSESNSLMQISCRDLIVFSFGHLLGCASMPSCGKGFVGPFWGWRALLTSVKTRIFRNFFSKSTRCDFSNPGILMNLF